MSMSATYDCQTCGKVFTRFASYAKRRKGRFCSKDCGYSYARVKRLNMVMTPTKMLKKTLKKILEADLKHSKGSDQGNDFADVVAALADTEKTLDTLIQQGQQLFAEIDAYQEDFVLPVYPGYEEDFKLDPHDPKVLKEFLGRECYGEPMIDIDNVKRETIRMLDDLGATKETAIKLHREASGKHENLTGKAKSPAAAEGKGKSGHAPKGKSRNGSSDITGIEEPKEK